MAPTSRQRFRCRAALAVTAATLVTAVPFTVVGSAHALIVAVPRTTAEERALCADTPVMVGGLDKGGPRADRPMWSLAWDCSNRVDGSFPYMAVNVVNNSTTDYTWVRASYDSTVTKSVCVRHSRGTTLGVKVTATQHGGDNVVRDLTFIAAASCDAPPAGGSASASYTVKVSDTNYDGYLPYTSQPRVKYGNAGTAPVTLGSGSGAKKPDSQVDIVI